MERPVGDAEPIEVLPEEPVPASQENLPERRAVNRKATPDPQARQDQLIRLLPVEFALLGEGFRAGFAAIATAFEAAAKDPESPFAAVRSRGRERVLTKESGASYELEIELRSPDAERGR